MDQNTRDENEKEKLLKMLREVPLSALEIQMNFRRLLQTLQKEGKIRCSEEEGYRWFITE